MTDVLIPTTTIFGVIVSSDPGGILGIANEGEIFEAADLLGLAPVVGDTVLADYLPSSGQWIVVAIVT